MEEMKMKKIIINMSIDDFAGFVRDRHTLRLLVDVLLGNATLGYGGKDLSFNADAINTILKAVDYEAYTATLDGLKMSNRPEPHPMD